MNAADDLRKIEDEISSLHELISKLQRELQDLPSEDSVEKIETTLRSLRREQKELCERADKLRS